MKDEIIQKLSVVLGALDTIPVSGKQNLANLSGSIALIEEVVGRIKDADVDFKSKK